MQCVLMRLPWQWLSKTIDSSDATAIDSGDARYQFNDEVHEVLANDTEPIYIPKRSHSISSITKRLREEDEARRKELRETAKKHGIPPVLASNAISTGN